MAKLLMELEEPTAQNMYQTAVRYCLNQDINVKPTYVETELNDELSSSESTDTENEYLVTKANLKLLQHLYYFYHTKSARMAGFQL